MRVLGIHVDWFFHLTGALLAVLVAARFLSLRRSLQVAIGLLVSKEIFDVFAKTRLEYIRPPTLDLAVDMSSGGAGILIAYLLLRRRRKAST
jgi:hypothetical protein